MARVLVAEDSLSMRALIKSTLEANGYEVVAVCDGQEGLNFAKEEAVDLVITDVNMPNMDGLTLIGKLRELPKHRHTPTVAPVMVLSPSVSTNACLRHDLKRMHA